MNAAGYTRQAKRFQVKSSISFKSVTDPTNQIYTGLLHDLNHKGMSIFSANILREGEKIRLWLLNPQDLELTRLDGSVVWVGVDEIYGDSPYWVRAGICFETLMEPQKEAISRLLPADAADEQSHKVKKLAIM